MSDKYFEVYCKRSPIVVVLVQLATIATGTHKNYTADVLATHEQDGLALFMHDRTR